jgi:hypothetical protein
MVLVISRFDPFCADQRNAPAAVDKISTSAGILLDRARIASRGIEPIADRVRG